MRFVTAGTNCSIDKAFVDVAFIDIAFVDNTLTNTSTLAADITQ